MAAIVGLRQCDFFPGCCSSVHDTPAADVRAGMAAPQPIAFAVLAPPDDEEAGGLDPHVHSSDCNHSPAPEGAVFAAAWAGNVASLQAALDAGGSTEEADEVG